MAWVPQSGRVGIGFSIISYNGKVWVGVNSDQNQVPDPEVIVTAFKVEFEAMKQLALAEAVAKASAMVNVIAAASTATASDGKTAQAQKRARPIQSMISQMDSALQTVDGLLEQQASETIPPASCAAMTRSGSPCKNRALPGSDFCRIHQPD